MKQIFNLRANFLKNESGGPTVEFVILAPLFFMAFFWIFETGLIMLRFTMLERSLDLVVREIRVNDGFFDAAASDNERFEQVKSLICSSAVTLKDCEKSLLVELIEITDASGFVPLKTECIDRVEGIDPVITFDVGSSTQADSTSIMYIRACYLMDPILPAGIGLNLTTDASGAIALVTDSAFVNEPS
jgi:hypothetical protein